MESPLDVFMQRVYDAIQDGDWVADGSYGKVRVILWGRAYTVVGLDFPFHVSFTRLLKRTFRKIIYREEFWNENRESLRMALSNDSILLWSIKTCSPRKREYPKLMKKPEYTHLEFIRHKTPR